MSLFALMALAGAGCSPDDNGGPPTDAQFSQAARAIEEHRTRSVGRARELEQAHQGGRISDVERVQARIFYLDAAAAFNGWLSGLQTAINTGESPRDDPEFGQRLSAAVSRSVAFEQHADQLLTRSSISATSVNPELLLQLTPILLDAAGTVFNWVTKRTDTAREDARARALAEIDRLRWPQDPTAP